MGILNYITDALSNIKNEAEATFQKYSPDIYKQVAQTGPVGAVFAKAPSYILAGINEGFDQVDKAMGTASHSLLRTIATGKPTIEQGSTIKDIGSFAATIGGEKARFPAEVVGGLFLPPFGIGSVGRAEKALTTAERALLQTEKAAQFSEQASRLTKMEDIAKVASESFPGISKQLAEDLGTRFAKVSDPVKIGEDLTKIAKDGLAPSQYGETLGKAFPEIADQIQSQHIVKTDAVLASEVQKIMDQGFQAAETAAKTRLDDVGVSVGQELIRKYLNDADALIAKGDKVAGDALYTKAIDVAQKSVANLTEGGRFLRAASLISELGPEGVVRMATRQIEKFNRTTTGRKLPSLTPEQAREFSNEMRRIQRIETPIDRAKAIQKLQDKINALLPSSFLSKTISVWKAGLLTGIKTSMLNTSSNLAHFASEIIKDAPAALVDSVASLFTGKRTKTFSVNGSGKGLKEGFEKGFDYLKTGFDERNLGEKMNYRKVNFGKSTFGKMLQAYEETVFRTIGAEDQPFYYGAKARSLYDQAIATTKNEGLRGADKMKRINELIQNPTDEMLKNSVMDAQVAVFGNDTAIGKAAKAFQRIPGGEFIVPFSRTPAAVAMQLVSYSPLGFVKTAVEQIQKGEFSQRLFSQSMGRAITGTGLMYIGSELWKNGRIALGYPTSEKEQKQWELEGKQANSIKIGDEWRSLNVLGPGGLTMVVGGYMAKALKESGSYYAAAKITAAGLGKAIIDQTFLKGMSSAIDALKDPARFGENFVNGFVGSVVPTIVADTARAIDPQERRDQSALERIQSRIPLWRQSLQPQVNVLGEKRKAQDFLTIMLDPTRPGMKSQSPVTDELARLWKAGYRPTPTQLGTKKEHGFAVLSEDENTRLWIYAGDLLHGKLYNLIKMPQYQALTDDKKEEVIMKFTKAAYTEARATMVAELTAGLTGEELKKELGKLKDGKVLTRDAFARWNQIRSTQ